MGRNAVGAIPALEFGNGCFEGLLANLTSKAGGHIAVVTGGESFRKRPEWERLLQAVTGRCRISDYSLKGEPTPDFVDAATEALRKEPPDAVVAIGGGSAMDAGKAIAAMVPVEGSVQQYLEGVGDKAPEGETLPMIAVPTTSGTGSEATKNAVISRVGDNGFKKSLRHDNYIPSRVYIDPGLIAGCPLDVTRFSGLDAITQLLEAYVSTGANSVTDMYSLEGLRLAGKVFPRLAKGEEDPTLRADMALAAYYSGIALANAGLGVVHGLASPLGAAFPAPHGAVCGTLVAAATEIIITKLEKATDGRATGLNRYSDAAVAVCGADAGSPAKNRGALIELLASWVEDCEIPRLSAYGMARADVSWIASGGGQKNTPARLSQEDIEEILIRRL